MSQKKAKASTECATLKAEQVPLELSITVLRIDGKPAGKKLLSQIGHDPAAVKDDGTPGVEMICRLSPLLFQIPLPPDARRLSVLCRKAGGELAYYHAEHPDTLAGRKNLDEAIKANYARTYEAIAALPFAYVEV